MRKVAVLFLILLVIAIPLTLYLISQQQDIRQRASEGTTEVPTPVSTSTMATLDGQPISEQDVKAFADQAYKTVPTDPSELKTSLNQLVEKKILEKVVTDQNIEITDQDITNQLAKDDLSNFSNDPIVRENARISVMKRKIELQFTKTRTAYTVGFWLPPVGYGITLTQEEQDLLAKQRADTKNALAEILKGLQAGDGPLVLAKSIVTKYPSLNTVMSVNGFLLGKTANEVLLTQPTVYSFQKGRQEITFFKTLFSLTQDQVALVEDPKTSSGGVVIKVTGVTDGPFDNYSAWFADQKATRVVIQ